MEGGEVRGWKDFSESLYRKGLNNTALIISIGRCWSPSRASSVGSGGRRQRGKLPQRSAVPAGAGLGDASLPFRDTELYGTTALGPEGIAAAFAIGAGTEVQRPTQDSFWESCERPATSGGSRTPLPWVLR